MINKEIFISVIFFSNFTYFQTINGNLNACNFWVCKILGAALAVHAFKMKIET